MGEFTRSRVEHGAREFEQPGLVIVAIAAFDLDAPVVKSVTNAAKRGPAGVKARDRRIGVGDDTSDRRELIVVPIFDPIGAAFEADVPATEACGLRRPNAESQRGNGPKQ